MLLLDKYFIRIIPFPHRLHITTKIILILKHNWVTDQTRQSQWGPIALAHEESLKDDPVEGSI